MNHKSLREFIREELRRGEVNEIFGWVKRAWRDMTLSDWEIVNRAAKGRAPGILPLTSAQWRSLPRDVRDRLADASNDWLDDPGSYDPDKWGLKMLKGPPPTSEEGSRGGSGKGSGRSSRGGGSGGGGGSWGGGGGYGYYDPYDPYGYGYGYGYGYYGGRTSVKDQDRGSDVKTRTDGDKSDKREEESDDDSDSSDSWTN